MSTGPSSPAPPPESAISQASRTAVTWVGDSLSRMLGGSATLASTGRWLSQQLWIWPIIAAVLMGSVGWYVHSSVEDAMREQRIEDLTTQVETAVAAVKIWIHNQSIAAELVARDEQIAPLVAELLELENDADPARALLTAKSQSALKSRLQDAIKRGVFDGYFVVSPRLTVLAADQSSPVGQKIDGYRADFFEKSFAGESVVSRPYPSPIILTDAKGRARTNLPTMRVATPIKNATGKIIAGLGLRIAPEKEFTRVFEVGTFGKTGETYAFDAKGLLLTQSRFDDQLKQIGLLTDNEDSASILTVEVRDPGVDMAAGERPAQRRPDQPLTKLAASAIRGENGHDPDGYRDYRGSLSVGAWRWVPEMQMGIASEITTEEAFAPVQILRRSFWVLMTLLGIASVGIYIAMWYMAEQQKALQEATLAAKQLGQYKLDEKIGSGGMGTVYRGHHAMLRRPTAIKLLDPARLSDVAVARFEREVQLTSALTHPNTIAIYDYGRTPDGIFYYAMEFLEGMNLEDLVEKHGPVEEARAVFLLKQICGALAEAHAAGLVHRDIKPGNIFLTTRGGMRDFVKVLDFGLVKSTESAEAANITSTGTVSGTPLYLSPEAIERPDSVDARADVYAVGAVAYFLLTGKPVFTGATIMEICMKHIREAPAPIAQQRGKSVSSPLETWVNTCLAKAPEARPGNAGDMLAGLEKCEVSGSWTSTQANAWWENHLSASTGKPSLPPDPSMTTDVVPIGATAAFQVPTKR